MGDFLKIASKYHLMNPISCIVSWAEWIVAPLLLILIPLCPCIKSVQLDLLSHCLF